MKKIIVVSLSILFQSCLKLDSNMYNSDNTIKSYQLDNFKGEQDFILDNSYSITSDKIHQLAIESKGPNEASATIIQAIYLGEVSRIATDTVILYCHGNKWHMDFYWQRAKLLAHTNGKHRYGVMMMDYRGYGLSEGETSESGLTADVNACAQWLKDKGLSGDRLVMYGFSLGSVPACELTLHPIALQPNKLILESPIGSTDVMANDGSQLNMPGAYFTDIKADNINKIKSVTQPLLWLHGTSDNFLSYKTHGEAIFNNHKGVYKEKFLVSGADHGEVPEKSPFDAYQKTIGQFILR